MAKQSKADRLAEIHAEALEEFDDIQAAHGPIRAQCIEDRRFYSVTGAQWDGPHGEQFANRPRFEFNKVHLACIRIFNEYRNNRITVDFQPHDGRADDDLADTCDGLYRADEKSSSANEAYDNCFEEGVGGGFGAWRLRACYEDEDDDDNEHQRIRMEPIFDADSCVFFDLGAQRQDKSDAKRCYVLVPYTHKAAKAEFGIDAANWPKDVTPRTFQWCTADIVWLCEHYRIEEKSELVHFFRGLDEEADELRVTEAELEADESMLEELLATGFRKVREKRVRRRVVHKYLLSGTEVIEDCGLIPGKHIPIIPFFGKRWVIDGVEQCMGHVRLAKDAQRLTNMLMSWLAEMAGRFDIEKPILTPEQIAGHSQMWAQDNVSKFPYLLINPSTDEAGQRIPTGPVAYTKAPNIPPAIAALAQIAEQALQDLLGNQQAGEQLQPNMSGKAVELIQQRLDMQVFIYMSNLAKAMKRSGEVWLSMAKEILVESGRRMKTINGGGESASVVLNEPAYNEDTGEDYLENDLSRATFEVDVDVGPSSSSKRAGTVRALTGLASITDDPETKQALTLATIANIEGEGLSDLRDWARQRAIRKGIVKPSEEERTALAEEQQNTPPDPQAMFLQASAEQAQADAGLKRAGTVEKVASADLKRAQTAETLAQTMGSHASQQIASAKVLQGLLAGQQQPAAPQF